MSLFFLVLALNPQTGKVWGRPGSVESEQLGSTLKTYCEDLLPHGDLTTLSPDAMRGLLQVKAETLEWLDAVVRKFPVSVTEDGAESLLETARNELPRDFQGIQRFKCFNLKLAGLSKTSPRLIAFTARLSTSCMGDEWVAVYKAEGAQWRRILDPPLEPYGRLASSPGFDPENGARSGSQIAFFQSGKRLYFMLLQQQARCEGHWAPVYYEAYRLQAGSLKAPKILQGEYSVNIDGDTEPPGLVADAQGFLVQVRDRDLASPDPGTGIYPPSVVAFRVAQGTVQAGKLCPSCPPWRRPDDRD